MNSSKKRVKWGAPFGNQNAVQLYTADRITIRLYPDEKLLVKAIAQQLNVSKNEVIRRGIQLLATELKI